MRRTCVGSEPKKTRRRPAGDNWKKGVAAALRDGLRDRGVEFDRVRMITFNAVHLVASLQHAIELVDEHGNRLVAFVRLNGRIHVGALDLDMSLGRELHSNRRVAVTLQFNPHSDDAFLVPKQSLGFLSNERLQGRCQIEVNAGYD